METKAALTKPIAAKEAAGPFNSTNFTLQTLLLLVFVVLELIGFPIEVATELKVFLEATIFAAVGFWGTIREWVAKGINVAYTGNVLTYALAFIAGLFPALATYTDELSTGVGGLIDAIGSGNYTLIFTAVFTLANIVWQIVKGNKAKQAL